MLARLALPAVVVGVGSALALLAVTVVADRLEDFLWDTVPGWFDLRGGEAGWILGVLSVVGLVTGLLVSKLPGHAGPDPAHESLVSPPMAPGVLPGLAVVLVVDRPEMLLERAPDIGPDPAARAAGA